jgi:hypothetical protein
MSQSQEQHTGAGRSSRRPSLIGVNDVVLTRFNEEGFIAIDSKRFR